MIGEKIMACNRRRGGSAKDVYDLFVWSQRPFNEPLVRLIAVLKAWTDQRRQPLYSPQHFLAAVVPRSYRWEDIADLVPHRMETDTAYICDRVRQRFDFLADCTAHETELLEDQTSHREHRLFGQLCADARDFARTGQH
jgi:hypothetical protein